jgi:hypothetical protein
MAKCRRSQIFIDREVQGALMMRVGFYWLFCLLSIVLMVLCWNVVTGPRARFVDLFLEIYQRHAPALVATLILLPLVMIDVVRMSNRFVGPIVRLRSGMRELTETGRARPIAFRDHDYWHDLAADFNRVAQRVEQDKKDNPTAGEPLVFDDVMVH